MLEKIDLTCAKNGDEESIEKIFKRYKGLVYKNSSDFFLKGADFEDIIQEGFIGLFNAIKNYDESRNIPFATYAYHCIRRQIINAVKNSNANKYKPLNEAIKSKKENLEQQERILYTTPSIFFEKPDEILLGKEFLKLLEEYLNNNLSEFERNVLSYLIKQYTCVEIAIILNDNPKRMGNTIQRIKRKIRNYLKSYMTKNVP